MDPFHFEFDTDSPPTNDTNSNSGDLDWTAFQSAPPPTTNSPFSPVWLSQQDDAVAPDNRSSTMTTPHDDEIYFEIEHFFNGLNQQQQQQPTVVEQPHLNISISHQTMNNKDQSEPVVNRAHLSSIISERLTNCLPAPLVPRLSSSRSQCYHKLPDHAVKMMQEWYNANLDDPYPRSPDKKRFITEGNITAQQCRSWFANRRQRLKHVKRNQSKSSFSRFHHSLQARLPIMPIEEQSMTHEHCYYCQQQTAGLSSSQSLSLPSTPTTTMTTTTLNVVINQQTVEQLIQNSLRKLLYPALM